MAAWRRLAWGDEESAWARFHAGFAVPWGSDRGKEPGPSQTDAIAHAYADSLDQRYALERDLNRKILVALQRCVSGGETLAALDWQHDCYRFDPHAPFDTDDLWAWKVPVLPDGDFYVFLPDDCRFCIYGDCLNETLTIFGQSLLDVLAAHPPLLFSRMIRINGEPFD